MSVKVTSMIMNFAKKAQIHNKTSSILQGHKETHKLAWKYIIITRRKREEGKILRRKVNHIQTSGI